MTRHRRRRLGRTPCRPATQARDYNDRMQLERLADEDLMERFRDGDYPAFEVLYKRHSGALYRFVLRSVEDHAVAEELYQDAWTRLIDARRRYRPTARFTTYLYRIAHNRVVDYFRSRRPMETIDDNEAEHGATGPRQDPDRVPDREAAGAALRRAIGELPLEQRTAFLLRAERNLSLEQIGEISGVGRETVKSRLRYAMNKLRESLGGVYEQTV